MSVLKVAHEAGKEVRHGVVLKQRHVLAADGGQGLAAGNFQIDGIQRRGDDDAGKEVAHLELDVDQPRAQPGGRAAGDGGQKRQKRAVAGGNDHGGDDAAQGEGAVHGKVGKVQNGIGNEHAHGQQGVDEPLLQRAGQGVDKVHQHSVSSSRRVPRAAAAARPGKAPRAGQCDRYSASAISVARAMRSSGMVTPSASQASVLT